MQTAQHNHELVSALADGELGAADIPRAFDVLAQDPQAQTSWRTYHLIGDVLRAGPTLAVCSDARFMQTLSTRLLQEAGMPRSDFAIKQVADNTRLMVAKGQNLPEELGANDPVFQWKMVAGLASLAAVAVLGWNVLGQWGPPLAGAQLAQVQAQVSPPELVAQQFIASGEPQVMIRDPQLDALLAAHKQFGGASALQMPTGFLRNATFEGSAR